MSEPVTPELANGSAYIQEPFVVPTSRSEGDDLECGATTRTYLDLPGAEDQLLSFRYVKPWLRSLPVLDLGCSKGAYLRHFQNGSLGVDASRPNLEHCRQLGLNVMFGDLNRSLPFPSNQAQAIFCSHVMEHVDAPINLLRECHRVLSDKGVMILGLPIEGSIVNWLRGEDYYIDHPGHLYSFSLRNTSVLLDTTGFRLLKLYFEPRIVRNGVWLSVLQKLPKSVAFPLSIGYWAIAEKR